MAKGAAKKSAKQFNGGDSKLLPCTCVHEYQSQKYNESGRGPLRVHNATGTGFRCTVCGTKK